MSFLTRPLTEVGPEHRAALLRLCSLNPVEGVCLAHQVLRWERWGGGDVVVAGRPGHPSAGAWTTGSVMPFGLAPRPEEGHEGASRAQVQGLADHARRRLTAKGSVSGPRQDVEALWERLVQGGTRSREERWDQPLLVAPQERGSLAAAVLNRRPGMRWVAEGLHAASTGEAALVLPASVDMFLGELGYDPTSVGGAYARHVSWLVDTGRTYVVLDDGHGLPVRPGGPRQVAFKADVGALWTGVPGGGEAVAQLTGVWTRQDLRGQGVGAVALAATVDAVRRDHLRGRGAVSLYVNSFNTPALRLYRRLGFEQVGTFSTILL